MIGVACNKETDTLPLCMKSSAVFAIPLEELKLKIKTGSYI
jgi:hypothetical protein